MCKKSSIIDQEIWKAYPHMLGYTLSRGRWFPYDWLVYASKLLVNSLLDNPDGSRIIVNCPPRFGKSMLLSHWVPVWYLEHHPDMRVILSTYGQELSSNFGRQVRNTFDNPMLSTRLSDDSSAAHRFNTHSGGGMLCSGVGGPITGFGGNLILIDDVVKNWEDGQSPTMQLKTFDWYSNTLRSRLEPNGSIIILMTRWNEDDLTGMLLQEFPGEWTHIKLPATAMPEPDRPDPLGRQWGDSLCPERFNLDTLRKWKHEMPDVVWRANYQQIPVSDTAMKAFSSFGNNNLGPCAYNPALELDASFDFNISPGMSILIGQHTDDKVSYIHEIHEYGLDLPHSIGMLVDYCKEYNIGHVNIYGDSTGRARNVQTTQTNYDLIYRLLSESSISFSACVPQSQPPQRSSLLLSNHMFQNNKITVSPGLKILIRDLKYLKVDQGGSICKANADLSHMSDCLRYHIAQAFGNILSRSSKQRQRIGIRR
jgi:hypothetical protein